MQVYHTSFGIMDTNCYIAYDPQSREAAVIDAPDHMPDSFMDYIEENDLKLRYILLTHAHFDHILGIQPLKKRYPDAQIVIHEGDAEVLEGKRPSSGRLFPPGKQLLPADIVLKDGDQLSIGTETLTCLHTPGHSIGSCCYAGAGVLFTGDTLFKGTVGRTDMPTGSFTQMLDSVLRLADLPGDYKVYPGHMALTTLDYERETNPYITGNYDEFTY